MASRMCPLLIYQHRKQLPLARPNFASHFVYISSCRIPEAPLMSRSASNANRKTAGTAKYHLQSMCPLRACPPRRQGSGSARYHRAKAVWALTGCPRAAAELCGGKAETRLGGDQESESPAGARAELLIMPTVRAAEQTFLFGVHLTVTPNQPWYYKLKWRQLSILYLLYQYIVIVGKGSVI